MAQTPIVMKIENLVKKFGQNLAIDNVSLTIYENEIFGLVGPDGAGKSTLLRVMSFLTSPTSGKVEFLIKGLSNDSKMSRKIIGYMSQGLSLYNDLTVREHLELTANLYNISYKKFSNKVSYLVDRIKMKNHLGKLAAELSGGLKQRLGLMCCLLPEPKILLLDEPNTGVDPLSRRDFWKLLYEVNKEGLTIVISTSYMDEAELCHRLAFMHEGKIITQGSPEELKESLPQRIFELKINDPQRVYAVAELLKVQFYVRVQGEMIRLSCIGTGVCDEEEIIRMLTALQISFASLQPVEPSIEDIFVFKLRGFSQ